MLFVSTLKGLIWEEILYRAVEYLGYLVEVAQIIFGSVTLRLDVAYEVLIFPDLNG